MSGARDAMRDRALRPRFRAAAAGILLAGPLAAGCGAPGAAPEPGSAATEAQGVAYADTVRIPLPSGVPAADRVALVEAFAGAAPGSLVQFQAGTYVVGTLLRIDTPGLVLEGHPDGTVLRGCSLDDFTAMERAAAQAWDEDPVDLAYGPRS